MYAVVSKEDLIFKDVEECRLTPLHKSTIGIIKRKFKLVGI